MALGRDARLGTQSPASPKHSEKVRSFLAYERPTRSCTTGLQLLHTGKCRPSINQPLRLSF
jgi:hypothetical protein